VEFVELILNLLEKASVLLAAALVLLLLRPAEVWLGEAGEKASLRRRVFLVAVLGGLAIWGVFLGFEIGDQRFNVRTIGIIAAGYLGGSWVGLVVGAAAGLVYAVDLSDAMSWYVLAASILDGWLAGLWSKKWGTGVVSVIIGAVVIQALHHVGLGGIMALVNFDQAIAIAANLELHAAKIAANVVGVSVFMGLLSLIRELEFARRQAQTSRDLVRSARLEALQYQVRPHFLFNLLNTLAYLIRTDAKRARELTLDLAEFLRYTLAEQDDRTTLGAELEQIERYVDLERARFGDGLDFDIAVGDARLLDEVIVPPLILQPVVENAIRHGSRDGKVCVKVEVTRHEGADDKDSLVVRVLDDGPGPGGTFRTGDGEPSERIGVGLRNVRERLERFYRGAAQLSLADRPDTSGACAECRIPIEVATRQVSSSLKQQAREKLKEVIS
jgi:two-component system, LytTR family, sensor kinase